MAFHLSLIRGLLANFNIMGLVFFTWFLYAKKTEQFVTNTLRRPDFSFLNLLCQINNRKLYTLMVCIQFLLFLPIFFYIIIIFIAGVYFQLIIPCLYVLVYAIILTLYIAGNYFRILQNPGKSLEITGRPVIKHRETPYWSLFIRYIVRNKKLLYIGMKVYSCTVLCLMVMNQTRIEYDLSMILLFFSLGILGHGLLIHQLRDLEESRLTFYRTAPFSLSRRFIQYSRVYFILLIPEMITIGLLTPYYLHYHDAAIFFVWLQHPVVSQQPAVYSVFPDE
jgi:hypothetical protein